MGAVAGDRTYVMCDVPPVGRAVSRQGYTGGEGVSRLTGQIYRVRSWLNEHSTAGTGEIQVGMMSGGWQ